MSPYGAGHVLLAFEACKCLRRLSVCLMLSSAATTLFMPTIPSLQSLEVMHDTDADRGLHTILTKSVAEQLPGLTSLRMPWARPCGPVTCFTSLRGLQSLHLDGSEYFKRRQHTTEAQATLHFITQLTYLHHLELSCFPGIAGISVQGLQHLRSLHLSDTSALRRIHGCEALRNLQALSLEIGSALALETIGLTRQACHRHLTSLSLVCHHQDHAELSKS